MNYKNLDESKAFHHLQQLATVDLKSVMSAERLRKSYIEAGAGLTYYYGGKIFNNAILQQLQGLADEMTLIEQYKNVLDGQVMNIGEQRRVLHHLSRGQLGNDVVENGKNLRTFYEEQRLAIADFAKQVHSGLLKGSTGKPFNTLVQIGIGGSDLGPRAIYLALEHAYRPKMAVKFVSNVDPDDMGNVLEHIDLETTLFILVSKSGTTSETLANLNFVLQKGVQAGIKGYNPHQHMVVVTSETSPLANSSNFLKSFYIDDYIGGRFSSCSAVGGVVLTLALGEVVFKEFLDGAAEADRLALNPTISQNAALLDALLGVYERNILGYATTSILPYSQALQRFPAHLQQADMESNGKTTNRRGETVHYVTGPVIFGESGTNGQHSFYQLLHQGCDIISLQFIGFKESQMGVDALYEETTSQTKLNANLIAQMAAFVMGKDDSNLNKNFNGGRPVSLLKAERLEARVMGALLAHYENKIMFQGFIWNLNSFDQEGVQLGKVLANQLLKGQGDDILKAFNSLMA